MELTKEMCVQIDVYLFVSDKQELSENKLFKVSFRLLRKGKKEMRKTLFSFSPINIIIFFRRRYSTSSLRSKTKSLFSLCSRMFLAFFFLPTVSSSHGEKFTSQLRSLSSVRHGSVAVASTEKNRCRRTRLLKCIWNMKRNEFDWHLNYFGWPDPFEATLLTLPRISALCELCQ